MSDIKKIILTGHPLRDYTGRCTTWFPDLISYYVESVSNLPVYTIVPQTFTTLDVEDNYIIFDYVKFFGFYGINHNINAWGELYYRHEYNEEAYNYVESIFKDSLVIGYEIDSCILNILDYFGIPYIDAYISPIRFLDDQLFSFTSNNENIYNKILKYRLPEEKIYIQANYLKTFYRQRYWKEIGNVPAVLFIGQTDFDRSLIHPETGELYSILNHKEEFKEAIKGYNKIYYKRHPKVSHDKPVLNYIRSLTDVEIIDTNFYLLCSRPDIKKVVSISSGGLIEAKYFGKETQHLLHSSVNLQYGTDFDKDKYINVFEDFFSLKFWSDILSNVINTKTFSDSIGFYGQKNKLRNSRGYKDWWGYEDFDHEMLKSDIINNNQKRNSVSKVIIARIARTLYHITYNKTFARIYYNLSHKN
jgi:hypothetical protein